MVNSPDVRWTAVTPVVHLPPLAHTARPDLTMRISRTSSPQILIIGAGIGGLTTAALLAQAGYRVTVLEAGTYPGGSAGTFYHQGFRYDAGATLAGGFQPGGPHAL